MNVNGRYIPLKNIVMVEPGPDGTKSIVLKTGEIVVISKADWEKYRSTFL